MVIARLASALALWLALASASMAAADIAVDADLAPDQARIEVTLEAPEQKPFDRQMVLATIRGIYFVNISLEELTIPRMPGLGWMMLTQADWREATIDGRRARVMERRIAFFPQRPGQLTILPVVHRLQLVDARGERVWHAIRSAPLPIAVAPAPAAPGEPWLPLAALEFSDRWDKDSGKLQDGESAERTVVLKALGATAEMLPTQPPMRQPWMITFSRPEQRKTELTPLGPLTTVVWQWTMRPTTGEPGVIPEVVIPWYDTREGKPRTIVLKAAPFGYQSFRDNNAEHWRPGFGGIPLVTGAALLGALFALVVLTPGQRIRSSGEIVRLVRRCLPDPHRLALRRAARRRDLGAFRRAATSLMAEAGLTPDDRARLLEPVDRRLFGKDASDPAGLDLRNLAEGILRAATRTAGR